MTGIPCAKTRLAVSYARVVRTKSRMETSVQVMISLPYGISPVPAPRKVNFLCLMKKFLTEKKKILDKTDRLFAIIYLSFMA